MAKTILDLRPWPDPLNEEIRKDSGSFKSFKFSKQEYATASYFFGTIGNPDQVTFNLTEMT